MSWSEVIPGLRDNLPGLVAALLVATVCAYIGVYVVLKRIVFVGAALAQISSAGAALAFFAAAAAPAVAHHPLAISVIVTLLGALFFARQASGSRIPQESNIGIGYLIASGLSLMFIVRSARGMDDVRELLDGNVVALQWSDVRLMALAFGIVLIIHGLFYKQFLFTSFDPEMAATQGFRHSRWEGLFYSLLAVTMSVAIEHAGLLSAFTYLVIPPVTGLMVARRMNTAFVVSIISALLATLAGFTWSLKAGDMPTSPPTIAAAAALLSVAWLVRRVVRPT